ncbi:MAG: Ribose 1,5-bisphosphate isomerase, partial [Bacteroidota bacterium]|nr:Ribose 1,5-bisphosphate isomerase [Bacteroidota bacterium]
MDIFKIFRENKLVDSVQTLQNTTKTVNNLISLISDNKVSNSVREMLKGLRTVIVEKPNISSVNHYINHFLLKIDPENQPIVIKELLEVFHERWKNVDRKTAEIANHNFDFENKTLLLYGNDINIQSLIELLDVSQKKFKVIQVVTSREVGREQVKIIASKGIPVKAIDVSGMGKIFNEIDIILMGCDIIMHETFIAKSGTHLLLAAAKTYDIPVFVLADSRKILNKKFFPQSVIGTFIGKEEKSATQIWKDPPENVEVVFNYIEEIPNNIRYFF